MIQKLVLPVDTTTGTKFKDGDLIIFDEKLNAFYKTNKENLFSKEQKERIDFMDKINKSVAELKASFDRVSENLEKMYKENYESLQSLYKRNSTELNEKIDNKISMVDIKMSNMQLEYSKFLLEFKETNTKLIEMVESVVVK